MKKSLVFLIMFFGMFIGNVKASVNFMPNSKCDATLTDGHLSSINCHIAINVSNNITKYNKYTIELKMPSDFNITSTDVNVNEEWKMTSRDDANHKYIFESYKSEFAVGDYVIADIIVYGSSNSNNCDAVLKPSAEIIKRTCSIYDGHYYNFEGHLSDKLTYEKECLSHTCEILEDGTRYGKNGEVVTENDYKKQCEKNICTKIDDTYFGKDGSIVSKEEYEKVCLSHTCEILEDGTRYGKNGEVVTENDYKKQCEKNICTKIDDTYFGKDGSIISKEEYEKVCNENHIEEKIKCEFKNHQYYDKDGNIVTKEDYEKSCGVPTKKDNKCVSIDGKFYDSVGKIVSEDVYKVSCLNETVENPKTGSNISYIGLLIVGTISLLFIKKKNKIYKI